jgi:carbonic anhydrase
MKTFARVLLAFLVMAGGQSMAAEVINFDIRQRSCIAHGESHWGYYGQLSWHGEGQQQQILLPNDWGHLYEACGRALAPLHRQSPIELSSPDALQTGDDGEIEFPGYGKRTVKVEHNCHTVQATLTQAGQNPDEVLRIGTQAYRLLQFHLHTPSEHVIHPGEAGSINYPGELHFVHAAVKPDNTLDSGRLAVIGVFIDLSDKRADASADRFFSALARDYMGLQTSTDASDPIEVDLGRLKRNRQRYWRYAGSLTTPPCSETVEWIVMAEPIVLSVATFRQLQDDKLDVGFANARPPFLPTRQHQLRFVTR